MHPTNLAAITSDEGPIATFFGSIIDNISETSGKGYGGIFVIGVIVLVVATSASSKGGILAKAAILVGVVMLLAAVASYSLGLVFGTGEGYVNGLLLPYWWIWLVVGAGVALVAGFFADLSLPAVLGVGLATAFVAPLAVYAFYIGIDAFSRL